MTTEATTDYKNTYAGKEKIPVFDLFVRLKAATHQSGSFIYHTEWSKATGKREFTFRGDRYTTAKDHPTKQLINLKNLMTKLIQRKFYDVVMIRDRRINSKDYVDYAVFKWNLSKDPTPEIDKIKLYMTDFPEY